jgi:hypothetical protein
MCAHVCMCVCVCVGGWVGGWVGECVWKPDLLEQKLLLKIGNVKNSVGAN